MITIRRQFGVSERRACRVLHQPRATQRRELQVPENEPRLVAEMTELAEQFGRYEKEEKKGKRGTATYFRATSIRDGLINNQDLDGIVGLLFGGSDSAVWTKYAWDAENRLTRVEPGKPVAGNKKVEFAYDYMGRRVEKEVSTYAGTYPNGSWSVTAVRRFVWSGWLLLMELDGENNVLRQYTWGLDLAGQAGSLNSLESAGGIGGLLAVHDTTIESGVDYVYFYDANGNVGQVIDLTAQDAPSSIKVKYEYDPYGTRFNSVTTGEYNQPFRFSTKSLDNETGLYYFGYRYYSPKMGRWINRDPIRELGGPNLYAYVRNQPTARVDALGRYGVDVHRYLTRFLAEAAGFDGARCSLSARRVGDETQAVDSDERGPWVSEQTRRDYHFVTKERLSSLCAFARNTCNARDIGACLHALEDSYSHQKGKDARDWNQMYGAERGHFSDGYTPDRTWKRPKLADAMAREVYLALQRLSQRCCCCPGKGKPFEEIADQVAAFNRHEQAESAMGLDGLQQGYEESPNKLCELFPDLCQPQRP